MLRERLLKELVAVRRKRRRSGHKALHH